jgi:xylulokinase
MRAQGTAVDFLRIGVVESAHGCPRYLQPVALVAGVDSSTQSTKVELRDLDTGSVLGAAQRTHRLTVPPTSEQDPQDWWGALCGALREALDQVGDSSEVVAIAVAGQQHGMVALDHHLQVLRPAILWNDIRSAADAAWLCEQMPPAAWAASCGSVPVAAFTIAKLSWLHRKEPENFARMAHVLLPHDWLNLQLTGRRTTDRGEASGTGYWSPSEGRYRFDLLGLVDDGTEWEGAVPEVLAPWEPAGSLTSSAAGQLGLRQGIAVAVGTGDNMAAALGIGLRPGELAVSIGTSGTAFTTRSEPVLDATGSVAGFADATGHYLPLVCTLNAALVTDSVARLLGVDHDALGDLALQGTPGCEGLVLVPYFAGERVPNRPDATGSLLGLRHSSTREHLARAAFEGVVCGLLDGVDALNTAGASVDPGSLVLLGGGAQAEAFRQILASLSGRPVNVPSHTQTVAAGAAVQAAVVATGLDAAQVAEAWGLRQGSVTHPVGDPQISADVRARFREARG